MGIPSSRTSHYTCVLSITAIFNDEIQAAKEAIAALVAANLRSIRSICR
jgi:hypothetical protein